MATKKETVKKNEEEKKVETTAKATKKEKKSYSLKELLEYEESAKILCVKYETQANLSKIYIDKYKKYNNLYNMIVDHIEDKINEEFF